MVGARAALCLLLAAVLAALPVGALKLRITDTECMSKQVETGENVEGSFVAIRGGRGLFGGKALFGLQVTDPSGKVEVDVGALSTYKFKFVAKVTGRYTFCLSVWDRSRSKGKATAVKAEATPRDVLWDLHVSHKDKAPGHDKVQNEHVDMLWDQISLLEEALESIQYEQTYHRNVETGQRIVAESLGKRVVNFAILRACALIGVSIGQVAFIQYLFGQRKGLGMLG